MKKVVKNKFIKVIKIAGMVFIYIFFAFCLLLLVLSSISKRNFDGTVDIFGCEMRIVQTESMEQNEYTKDDIKQYKIKSIKQYSAVFVELVPEDETEAAGWYNKLQVGDVLTCRYAEVSLQSTITHRITNIEKKPTGGYVIYLRGDNGYGTPDKWGEQVIDTTDISSPNFVLGKVVCKSYLLGLFTTSVKHPVGLILIIIVPCAILIIFQVLKIISIVKAEKRLRADSQTKEQQNEVEKLKRRIVELEDNNANDKI